MVADGKELLKSRGQGSGVRGQDSGGPRLGLGYEALIKTQIEKATAVLIGKALWTCRRAADMATFQFGERIKTQDFYGRPSEVGQYALHVQCAWRITQEDEDRVVVGSRDLYYPADYQDEHQPVPAEFDWDRDPNRRDKLLRLMFADGAREFLVQSVNVGAAGSLHIGLSGGLGLDVFPDDSLPDEYWRLFRPSTEEPHFVVTGTGIER